MDGAFKMLLSVIQGGRGGGSMYGPAANRTSTGRKAEIKSQNFLVSLQFLV